MSERLCGREQEFGVWLDSRDPASSKTTQAIIRMVLKIIPGLLVKTRVNNPCDPDGHYPPGRPGRSVYGADRFWFSNGWKIYEDQRLLEVASAESLAGSLDAVAQEKATERILNQAVRRLRRLGFNGLRLYKKNISLRYREPTRVVTSHHNPDGHPDVPEEDPVPEPRQKGEIDLADEASYGSHHNYSCLFKREKRIFALLRNFIPASLPLTGNGHILRVGKDKRKCLYGLSQRAAHITTIKSEEMAIEDIGRSLINLRKCRYEGTDKSLGRLHLVARDATRCEFQTWLVDAVTHLVLRLAEEDWTLPSKMRLRYPIKTFHGLNQRPNLDYGVLTVSGSKGVVEYNRIFLKAAKQLRPLSAMEKKALEEWARVLELLQAGAWKELVGELDWATKQFLIEVKMKERGFDIDSLEAWHLDQEYHNISSDPKESWFARMEEAGLIKRLVSEARIQRAIIQPPETRAKARGDFVAFLRQNKRLAKELLESLDWDMAEIKIGNSTKDFYFGHPDNSLLPQKDGLKKFIQESENFPY